MSNYQKVKLADICQIEGGGTPASNNPTYWNGGVSWATLVDVKNKYITGTKRTISPAGLKKSSAKLLPTGTVLFSSRATIGEVSITQIELATNQGFKNFICDKSKITPEYLYYFLKYEAKKIEDSCSGTTYKEISKSKIGSYKILLPSLDEQNTIVDTLDKASFINEKRKKAIPLLEDYTKSIFLEMFGDIESNHLGWEITTLEKITKKITDGTHQPPKFVEKGIPFIFISNIVDNEINLNTKKFISEETYRELTRRTPIEQNDILYTTVGSYGNPSIVKTTEKFCFQRHIAHIKPDHKKTNVYFLYGMLKSPSIKAQADKKVRGIAQKTLNLADLKQFNVILPPIELQNKFARIINDTEVLKQKMLLQLEELDNQFQALMQKYFSNN